MTNENRLVLSDEGEPVWLVKRMPHTVSAATRVHDEG